jgi:hypothetical protein
MMCFLGGILMKDLIIIGFIFLSVIYAIGHYCLQLFEFVTVEEEPPRPRVTQEEPLSKNQERPRRNTEYTPFEHEIKEIPCAYCDGKGIVKKYEPDTRNPYDLTQVIPGRGHYTDTCSNCGGSGYIYR